MNSLEESVATISIDSFVADKINYDKSIENGKSNVISNMISAKKQIQFKDNIEHIWKIQFTKTNIHC